MPHDPKIFAHFYLDQAVRRKLTIVYYKPQMIYDVSRILI